MSPSTSHSFHTHLSTKQIYSLNLHKRKLEMTEEKTKIMKHMASEKP